MTPIDETPIGDDLARLHDRLREGGLQRAYGSIIGYMSHLRVHLASRDGERAVSALYQGVFDMTYFALFPPALKSRGLKLAVVFDYESFAFEVWLAARNRALQRQYFELLRDGGWPEDGLVEPAAGVDAIVRRSVAAASALEAPESLTADIDAAAWELLADLTAFLDAHDDRGAI